MTDAPDFLRRQDRAPGGGLREDCEALDRRRDAPVGESARRTIGAAERARTGPLTPGTRLGRLEGENEGEADDIVTVQEHVPAGRPSSS